MAAIDMSLKMKTQPSGNPKVAGYLRIALTTRTLTYTAMVAPGNELADALHELAR